MIRTWPVTATIFALFFTEACDRASQHQGILAPVLDSLWTSKHPVDCVPLALQKELGRVKGCWTQAHDTVVYYYEDSTGSVVLVGLQWTADSGTSALSRFRILESALIEQLGAGQTCSHDSSGVWSVHDRRWSLNGFNRTVLVMTPTVDLPNRPLLRLVWKIGPPICSDMHSVPLAM